MDKRIRRYTVLEMMSRCSYCYIGFYGYDCTRGMNMSLITAKYEEITQDHADICMEEFDAFDFSVMLNDVVNGDVE